MKHTDYKLRFSTGDLESPVLRGEIEARRYFLSVVGTLYPAVFNEPRRNQTALKTDLTSAFWRTWKSKFRLPEDWVASMVWYQLVIEARFPELSKELARGGIPRPGVIPPGLENARPEDGGPIPPALPTEQTRSEYLDLCGRHYDARRRLLSRTLPRTRRSPKRHFEWLAHHTAGRLTIARVSRLFYQPDSDADGESTVRKAVQSLAHLLPLTLPSRQKTGK